MLTTQVVSRKDFEVVSKYTDVFVDLPRRGFKLPDMAQKICFTCEAVCNSISDDCPSCGVPLERNLQASPNPMPFIAAACASILMIGVMIGVAA